MNLQTLSFSLRDCDSLRSLFSSFFSFLDFISYPLSRSENYEEFNDEGGSVSEVEHDIQWSKLHKRFQKEFERILEDDLLEDLDIERGEFFAAMESILDGDATQLSSDGRYFVNAVMCSLDYSQFHRLMTQNIQAIMSREMPGMQFGSI